MGEIETEFHRIKLLVNLRVFFFKLKRCEWKCANCLWWDGGSSGHWYILYTHTGCPRKIVHSSPLLTSHILKTNNSPPMMMAGWEGKILKIFRRKNFRIIFPDLYAIAQCTLYPISCNRTIYNISIIIYNMYRLVSRRKFC